MICVRYHKREDETEDLELAGTPLELKELADLILNISDSLLSLDLDLTQEAYPYDKLLGKLQIRFEPEAKVVIQQHEGVLMISGSKENLSVMADNMLQLAGHPPSSNSIPHHLHLEYYPDHYFLDIESTPLVVSWNE